MTNHFEKPKDWNVAPQSSWVSGTPIGQSEIKMPNLGDPGSHENSSQKISFGDDGPQAEGSTRVGPGGKMVRPGQPCPPGYKSDSGACVADPQSTASLQARQKAMRGKEEKQDKTPGADPQLEGLRKIGVKSRLGGAKDG